MAKPSDEELSKHHRYFAAACNNRAWDLAEQKTHSPAETDEMLQCAAASAWHWSQIGQPIHHARANALLGWVNAVAGRPDDARARTDAAAEGLQTCGEAASEWDHAFQALLEARTRLAEGDPDRYRAALAPFDTVRAHLADPQDRGVFDRFRAALPDKV